MARRRRCPPELPSELRVGQLGRRHQSPVLRSSRAAAGNSRGGCCNSDSPAEGGAALPPLCRRIKTQYSHLGPGLVRRLRAWKLLDHGVEFLTRIAATPHLYQRNALIVKGVRRLV